MTTPVPQRRLGNSGLVVSRLCLGTMQFGLRTNEQEAQGLIAHAAEHGINFLDTADVYGGGASEEIIGRAVAKNRNSWVIATKLGVKNANPNRGGTSRRWIMEASHASLKRLGTDYI